MATQKGRESQTSGGGRRLGAPSRWMVAPCPGELGGITECKEREKQCRRVKNGEETVVRSGVGETEIQNTVETGGAEGG